MTMIPLQFGGIPGGMELAVILLIAILLFGANKIPKLARSTGQALGEFRRGREEIEQELQDLQDGSTTEASTTPSGSSEDTSAETGSTDASATDGGESDTDETDESK